MIMLTNSILCDEQKHPVSLVSLQCTAWNSTLWENNDSCHLSLL